MSEHPTSPPPLFAACDGIKFYGPKDELYVIHAGAYGSGNGAIVIFTAAGEPECKLTVNLYPSDAHDDLTEDTFWTKVDETGRLRAYLLETGFFEETGEWADAGYVKRYADKWRLARCTNPEHETRGWCRVACIPCRAAHDKSLADKETRIKARDTINRLKDKEQLR